MTTDTHPPALASFNPRRIAAATWTSPSLFALAQAAVGALGAHALVSGNGGVPRAALAVFLAVLMDMHDSRVGAQGRLQAAVARELTAFAVLLAQGLLPALLLSRLLAPVAPLDVLVLVGWTGVVALRVARRKVLADARKPDTRGLPLPVAVVAVTSLAAAVPGVGSPLLVKLSAALVVAVGVGVLLDVKLAAFREFELARKAPTLVGLGVLLLAWALSSADPWTLVAGFAWVIVVAGVAEEVFLFRARDEGTWVQPANPSTMRIQRVQPTRPHPDDVFPSVGVVPASTLALLDQIPMSRLQEGDVPELVDADDIQELSGDLLPRPRLSRGNAVPETTMDESLITDPSIVN